MSSSNEGGAQPDAAMSNPSPITTTSAHDTSNRGDMGDRIPSTTPGAEPPRDARDSGSARSHSMHLETSSSDRP